MSLKNMGASVRNRLLDIARERKENFELVLTQYALERLLYRLSISDSANAYVLKGALLFNVWFDLPHRPTRDLDLLGFGSADFDVIHECFSAICQIVVDDGVMLDPNSIKVAEIRKNIHYPGVRVTLKAAIDNVVCHLQVDIGYGDAITPGAEECHYPCTFPEFPTPVIKHYPAITVMAEKFEAIVKLGMTNSRMKDYFDLWVMLTHMEIDNEALRSAIHKTFERRNTPLPNAVPIGLSEAFARDDVKQKQWSAFLRKNKLEAVELLDIVKLLRKNLLA